MNAIIGMLPQQSSDSPALTALTLAVSDCVARLPPDEIRAGVASIVDLAELGRLVQRAYIGGAAGVSVALAHELMEQIGRQDTSSVPEISSREPMADIPELGRRSANEPEQGF